MRSLGIIELERLALLPPEYWQHHEYCFFLHDQVAELLIQYEQSGAHLWVTEAFEKVLKESEIPDADVDILDFLKNHDLVQCYHHHIVSHLVFGLTSDMLHFIYESMKCFEKRKFAVAFALLRKPLKENLLFLSWLLGNEEDFIARFEKDNFTTLNGVTPERRLQILKDAIAHLATKEAFDADILNDMIFSKANGNSFEPIWQRATHLITSHGILLRTEDLNINFVFHDAASDELFEGLYSKLPYVMLFAMQVSLECFARILRGNEHTISHLIISSLGAFESLFDRKSKSGITAMLRKELKPFLKCIHCSSTVRLTRNNAIGMYLQETLVCQKCGLASPFPLYWLFAQAKIKVSRENDRPPILEELKPPYIAKKEYPFR